MLIVTLGFGSLKLVDEVVTVTPKKLFALLSALLSVLLLLCAILFCRLKPDSFKMADVTGVFKSTVKMLKVRQKNITAIKADSGDDKQGTSQSGNTHMVKPNGLVCGESENNFSKRTRQIVSYYIV